MRTFKSQQHGTVKVATGRYTSPYGPLAVTLLRGEYDEPLAKLSVNMYKPECSHDSADLPKDCFYVKDWSENERIAEEALASGLFKVREDLPMASSGHVVAEVWQLLPEGVAK